MPDALILDAPTSPREHTPTAAVVDVLLSDLLRRQTLAAAAVVHLDADAQARCRVIIRDLRDAASRVAELPKRAAVPLSVCLIAVQRMAKRLAELESRIWGEIVAAVQDAEAAGTDDELY